MFLVSWIGLLHRIDSKIFCHDVKIIYFNQSSLLVIHQTAHIILVYKRPTFYRSLALNNGAPSNSADDIFCLLDGEGNNENPTSLKRSPAQLFLTSHWIRWPDEHTIQLVEVVVCFKSHRGTRHMPRVCVERRVRACSPTRTLPGLGWFNRLSRYSVCFRLFQVWYSSGFCSL